MSEERLNTFRTFEKKMKDGSIVVCCEINPNLRGAGRHGGQKMNILLSIKPKWAELIYSGKKKIEWRKNLPSNREIMNLAELRDGTDKVKVYLYETAPVKKVTGFFYWGGVGIIDVRKLEEDADGCVPIDKLKRYNGDRCSLCAWGINRPTRLHTPLTIDEFNLKRPPQSWCYTTRKITTVTRYLEDKEQNGKGE